MFRYEGLQEIGMKATATIERNKHDAVVTTFGCPGLEGWPGLGRRVALVDAVGWVQLLLVAV